jgi:sugar phosphate isomerase/epimerase
MSEHSIILSGFGDEAANEKQIEQQFAAFAAVGLQYYSIRFIDVGNGIKNVMQLTDDEVAKVRQRQADYGLQIATLGSPIGKVKLLDQDDGTNNRFVPFAEYLEKEVTRACDLANALGTKLIRGFSFYHPRGTDPDAHVSQVVDQLGQIAERCEQAGLIFGLEIEANLVGQTGQILERIAAQVNRPSLVLIFDAGNIITQGFSAEETFEQYRVMKPYLGWMHIKDYRHPSPVKRTTHVDEEALKQFVPANLGDSGHEQILRDFRDFLPELNTRLAKLGIPGAFLDLEPHVKGGGQFGGFSGPDGFGVAMRGLCRVLDYVGIDYRIRDFEDVRQARGF